MRVYLVRHAIAEDIARTQPRDDAARALTPEGIAKMRRNVRALERLGVRLTHIWSSPLLRARQTAELLAEVYQPQGGVREIPALAPDGVYDDLLEKARQLDADSEVAWVGHEPNLSELTTFLLTGQAIGAIEYKKGGVGCIEFPDTSDLVRGTLLWLLPPRVLRRLAD